MRTSHQPKLLPKFTQIATGQWKSDGHHGFNHTLYALGEDGKAYRYYAGKGWAVLDGTAPTQMSQSAGQGADDGF